MAADAMCAALRDAPGYTLSQQVLKDIAVKEAEASSNTAIYALKQLVERGVVAASAAPGKKTIYTLVAPTVTDF